MGLLSFFKRNAEAPRAAAASVSEPGDAVLRARTRARQRLIGAVVLLGIGIIGFPLVFETQPRPIPVNIPIETPAKDGAPALTMPAARTPSTSTAAPVAAPVTANTPSANTAPTAPPKPAPSEVITETREDAGRDVPAASAPAVSPAAAPKPAAAASKPATKPAEAKPAEPKPDAKPAAAKPTEAARAQALLEGKQAAKAADKSADKASDAGRFVVQVGAYADAGAARETRLKVEKLGLKTYTQVAATSAGNRIRVRAGPFSSRAEADKALAKARAAGLTAVVLTL